MGIQKEEKAERRASKLKQLETREGKQYESSLGYRHDSSTEQTEIPPYTCRPDIQKVCAPACMKTVVFDLETSSRGTNWLIIVIIIIIIIIIITVVP